MQECDLRKIAKCIDQMIFVDDEDNLLCSKEASLKVTEKEKELMKEFLELGKITAEIFIEMVKNNRDLDDYDFKTGAKALVEKYENMGKEFENFKMRQFYEEEEEWANNMCKID